MPKPEPGKRPYVGIGRMDNGYCPPDPTFLKFEDSIRDDQRLLDLLQDDEFAQTFSDLVGSRRVVDNVTKLALMCTQNDVHGLVAHYRQRGESYAAFIGGIIVYPARDSAQIEVLDELGRLGWEAQLPWHWYCSEEN